MLFVCGIPLLLMELTVGQFTRRGPVGALAKLCPLLKGNGRACISVYLYLVLLHIFILYYCISLSCIIVYLWFLYVYF